MTVNVNQTPSMTIVKSALPTTVSAVGTTIHYSFVVTNTGNVTLTNVAVNDSQTAPASALASGPSCPSTTLAPNAFETCTATYVVTQADLDNGSIADSATSSGQPPSGPPISSPPSGVTVKATQHPAISILTTAGLAYYSKSGTLIPYYFLVTNTGNVTLHNVTVTSNLKGLSKISCPKTTLSVAEAMTCTATYFTTRHDLTAGKVNNVAIATGKGSNGSGAKSQPSGAIVPAIHKHVHVTG